MAFDIDTPDVLWYIDTTLEKFKTVDLGKLTMRIIQQRVRLTGPHWELVKVAAKLNEPIGEYTFYKSRNI